MKEFIWNLVQKVGNYFFPQHEEQVRTKSEKVNGNTQMRHKTGTSFGKFIVTFTFSGSMNFMGI